MSETTDQTETFSREVYVNFEHWRGKDFRGRYHVDGGDGQTACGYVPIVDQPFPQELGTKGWSSRAAADEFGAVPCRKCYG
jgi:hypothetical protein